MGLPTISHADGETEEWPGSPTRIQLLKVVLPG